MPWSSDWTVHEASGHCMVLSTTAPFLSLLGEDKSRYQTPGQAPLHSPSVPNCQLALDPSQCSRKNTSSGTSKSACKETSNSHLCSCSCH